MLINSFLKVILYGWLGLISGAFLGSFGMIVLFNKEFDYYRFIFITAASAIAGCIFGYFIKFKPREGKRTIMDYVLLLFTVFIFIPAMVYLTILLYAFFIVGPQP